MDDRPKCKHLVPTFHQGRLVLGCGLGPGNPVPVTDGQCAGCPDNRPRGIQYPVTVRAVRLHPPAVDREDDVGKLVRVSPADDDGTYLGIFLGTHPLFISGAYDEKVETIDVMTTNTPLIFVPETGRLVYGAESWWEFVKGDDAPKPVRFAKGHDGTWSTRVARDRKTKGGASAK